MGHRRGTRSIDCDFGVQKLGKILGRKVGASFDIAAQPFTRNSIPLVVWLVNIEAVERPNTC
jgi:hypothetical protein